MEEFRTCKKCGKTYPLTLEYFHKRNNRKSGLTYTCKACRNKYNREHPRPYEPNLDWLKQYKTKNKEKLQKYFKEYNAKHKESRAEYGRIYYVENIEKVKARNKKWHDNNRDKFNIYGQRSRARKKELPHTLTVEQWEEIKKAFNNCCAYCGKKDVRLNKEHFIALSNGGEFGINNIIPSCKSCNSSKRERDFFKWYPKHKGYSKKREKKILDYLNYKNGIQQLSLM